MSAKTPGFLAGLWQSLKYTLEAIDKACCRLAAPTAVALISWCILQHDPFGLEKASNAASRRVVLRLLAADYSTDSPDQVSVVLIDDAYLRQLRESWPLPYAAQGAILRRLLAYKPKAVFVDILYRHTHAQRPGAQQDPPQALVDAVRPIPGAPVIFADLPPDELAVDDQGEGGDAFFCTAARHATVADADSEPALNAIDYILPHARQRGWNAQTAYVGWVRCNERYPLAIAKPGKASELPDYVTPAYAMYRAGCAAPGANCRVDLPANGAPEPIVLRWGALPSKLHVEAYGDEDDDNGDGNPYNDGVADVCQPPVSDRPVAQYWSLSFDQFARNFAKVAEDSHDPRLRLPCPSIDTLYVSELMDSRSERLEKLLAGRYVIVGVRLDGIPDFVTSPVNGLVPGATFHAMALDNLLRYHDDYVWELPEKRQRLLELLILLVIVPAVGAIARVGGFRRPAAVIAYVLFAAFLIVVSASFGKPGVAVSLAGLLLLSLLRTEIATMFVLVLLVGLAIEYAFVQLFSIAPGNWIGMLLATAAGVTIADPREEKREQPMGST